jgi:hypothetical protein
MEEVMDNLDDKKFSRKFTKRIPIPQYRPDELVEVTVLVGAQGVRLEIGSSIYGCDWPMHEAQIIS